MAKSTHEASEVTKSLAQLTKVETTEKQELAHKKASYDQILDELRDFSVETEDDFKYASDVLKHVKSFAKEIEEKRKRVTDPLNAALKEFRSWYKPALDVLEEGEALLKKKIGDYALRKEQEREAQMRAIAEASKSGDFDAAHQASQNLVETPVAKGITVRAGWDYTITDFDAIPREFLCVDHSAMKIYIKSALEAGNDPAPIAGISFSKTSGVIARVK